MNLKVLQYRYGLHKWLIETIVVAHSVLIFLFDTLILLLIRRKRQTTGKRTVLVIKLELIGDFIIWLDCARGLREWFPPDSHELTLVGNQAWTVLAEEIDCFDRIVPLERMPFILNPFYRFRKLSQIRREGYDILIDPTFSREFQFSPPIARISGAPERIAPAGACDNQRRWQKKISDRWYTRLLPSAPGVLMELRRHAEFVRGLGHSEFVARVPVYRPKATITPSNKSPYYVIAPGGSWSNKRWPIERFAAVATRLYQATGWHGIICGGAEDESLASQLQAATSAPLENLAGQTSLGQLAALIEGGKILIGNDTGAIHFAAAVSTPSVCIVGGMVYGRFYPYLPEEPSNRPLPVAVHAHWECYGCSYNCIHAVEGDKPYPCLANVSVSAVLEAVENIILA